MRKLNLIFGVCFLSLVMLSFQNCSDVKLSKTFGADVKYISGKVDICLDQQYSQYTVDTSMVVNLNFINKGRSIASDSDGDGLSDDDEILYGFDPLKRRTNQRLLDKICLDLSGSNDCSSVATSCTQIPNKLGLTDCDWQALGLDLQFDHPAQGLDSDKDGIADLIEIRIGTVPNQADQLGDPDHDLKLNIDEIASGSNIRYHDQPFDTRYAVQSTMTKKADSSAACSGEVWEMNISQLPWSPLPAVTDDSEGFIPSGGLTFTRPADSNTGVIVLKLRTKAGTSGNSKILFRSMILSSQLANLNGTISDFQFAGEVQP